jgi:hypothetical protein
VQTSIASFGQGYQRDMFGLLPVAARSNTPGVVQAPPTKPDRRKATVGKPRASTSTRGVRKWVTVTSVIGELKGDEGRIARDRAMLCEVVVEASSYVKEVPGYKDKVADWIEQRLKGVQNPEEGPSARRSEDGKTKYVKLSSDEKTIAVQMHDQMIAEGWSSLGTMTFLYSTIQRFRNVVASSINAEDGNNERKSRRLHRPLCRQIYGKPSKKRYSAFDLQLKLSIPS